MVSPFFAATQGFKPKFDLGSITQILPSMVNVPSSVSDLEWTTIFEWCMVRCEYKRGHQKGMCWKKKDWTMCSKLVNYPKCTSQRN